MKWGSWRIANIIVASLIVLSDKQAVVSIIHHGLIPSLSLIPFILLCTFQIIFLLFTNEPKLKSKGFFDFFFPIFVEAYPIFFSWVYISHLAKVKIPWASETGVIITFISEILVLFSLLFLRSGFSVLPEARYIQTQGAYRLVRHPIYSSYFLWYIGSCFVYQSWSYILYALLYFPIQYFRARQEEKKLILLDPNYAQYRKDTGMFIPKLKKQ